MFTRNIWSNPSDYESLELWSVWCDTLPPFQTLRNFPLEVTRPLIFLPWPNHSQIFIILPVRVSSWGDNLLIIGWCCGGCEVVSPGHWRLVSEAPMFVLSLLSTLIYTRREAHRTIMYQLDTRTGEILKKCKWWGLDYYVARHPECGPN